MMAGLLFARAGVKTVVVEKHADFLRDFRGDTVHPSTMTLMDELGLLAEFLKRPHQRLDRLHADFGGQRYEMVTLAGLPVPCPFIALMPQWDFLNFLAEHAKKLPTFTLLMQTEGVALLRSGERITGIRASSPDGPLDIRAKLTIAADGRGSHLRDGAGLHVEDQDASIDVMWFRISKSEDEREGALFHAGADGILVTIDRRDYWQCAFVIAKGGADVLRQDGLEAFRARIAAIVPTLAPRTGEIKDWDQVKLLTVAVNRLAQWHLPGLLFIGDAAHAMSPIGGVGINLAVQDAVAAANLLAAKLAAGTLRDEDLATVAERRLFPVKATQAVQVAAQNQLISPILKQSGETPSIPLALWLPTRLPAVRRLIGRALGLGFRPEHIRSPQAVQLAPSALSAANRSG